MTEERNDSTPELMAQVLIEMAKIAETHRMSTVNESYYRKQATIESKESMEKLLKEREHSRIFQRLAESGNERDVENKRYILAMEQAICDLIKATRPDKKAIAKLKRTLEPVYVFHQSCSSSSPILDAVCEVSTKPKKK